MTIRTWLASTRDYAAGLRLYEVLGGNSVLKRTLSHGPDAYNTPCLAEELLALLQAGHGDVDVPTPESTRSHTARPVAQAPLRQQAWQAAVLNDELVVQSHTKPQLLGAGGTLAELKAARRPLFDERSQLHAQLELLPNDEARRVAAFRNLELTAQLDASFAAERHLQQHGTLPVASKPAPTSAELPAELGDLSLAELKARRPNLASLVSNLKKKPHRAADLATAQEQLARLDAAIAAAKAISQ